MIERILINEFSQKVRPNKVLLLLGARRVGKTELVKKYLKKVPSEKYLFLNGDDQGTQDLLSIRTVEHYKQVLGKKTLLVIDEAQQIPDIGLKLKLIVDSIDGVSIIATGSSVFDLSNNLGEPLVGRKNTLWLYPIAQMEFSNYEDYPQTAAKLEERLLFGSYPELEQYPNRREKEAYLHEIINSYLLKDILVFEGIRKADKLTDLLRLIAFQTGKEVKVEELTNNLKGVSKNTVERYLDLLSKVFIIYNVRGFSRNLRKEIVKTSRWYFYDNGIRNAIIKNFNMLKLRNDTGELWENYLAAERIKFNAYAQKNLNYYFWRTYDQQELDWVEESSNGLAAYEFKWNKNKKPKAPAAWRRAYPEASFEVITPNNYLGWIR